MSKWIDLCLLVGLNGGVFADAGKPKALSKNQAGLGLRRIEIQRPDE